MRNLSRSCAKFSVLLMLLSHPTFPQTHVPAGNVNGKWLKQNSPYLIDGEIKIPRRKKLIIEPGVKVIFTGHYKLIVNGILEAKGAKQDSIYFSPSDTSVGWHGIRFIEAEGVSRLEYCNLKYGRTTQPSNDDFTDSIYMFCETDPECEYLNYSGGALFLYRSNPILNHCLISKNTACQGGGGIMIFYHSNPTLTNCEIKNNSAGLGGGIYCRDYSSPNIINCSIFRNTATNNGGGIYVQDYCNALIEGCKIEDNIGYERGGGIAYYTSAKPLIKNSDLYGNYSHLGGGIYVDEFYNEFREQPGKIDIRIINVKMENNSAEYGGGLWIRDTMGELIGVTICNNRASVAGGGVYIEHNPFFFSFSEEKLCNVYMNFARMMGNDLFRLGGEGAMIVPLDTFTVKNYSSLNAEPVANLALSIQNFKLTQVNADLYVSPDGDDSNSGLSAGEPLKTLKIALLRILSDSTNPRTVYMANGEYIFNETDDILLLGKHKYVTVKGDGFSDVIFGTDRITIFTPWYINVWALLIYASMLISVLAVVWNVRMRRMRMKSELERKEFEAKKLHEVDEIKSRFFTNISHEFRTPLTLILGPAKRIMEKSTDDTLKTDADFIERNAKKLTKLVDELLDISKIESGEMQLKACPVNIVSFVKDIAYSFSALADRKKITFNINNGKDELQVYLDKEKVDKILSNVLSNAFKFTPEGGKVELKIIHNEKNAELIISDTGIGIPAVLIDKIFDRFYQVDSGHTREHEGTGIGLSLTKELVELHKGKIEVQSEEGQGTAFRLLFPLGKEHLQPDEICEEETSEVDAKEEKTIFSEFDETITNHYKEQSGDRLSEKPALLVVEDNTDVRKYVESILESQYKIYEAKDGEEGLKKALEYVPDLIISDIMMPKLDGFQLCSKLKTDPRTSHIPVIMLTAKATLQDKISGLETGADEYLMKPFKEAELKARIRNLLEQRKRLHEYFSQYGLVELDKKNITSLDQRFLQRAVAAINEHLSDTSFGVGDLAEIMAVSKSLLFKKISSLMGLPPTELIKRTRLNKAAKLLESKSGNISEIALEVGFSNPSYFADCFKKQFGVIPSRYNNKSGNN